jgi:hypothetical protein
MVCLTFLYSGLAYLPARLTRHFNVAIAFWHHTALGFVLISFTLAYHLAKPDWLAVNNGLRRLTPFQSVVYNHWAPWSIYLFFYLILILRISKHRDGA